MDDDLIQASLAAMGDGFISHELIGHVTQRNQQTDIAAPANSAREADRPFQRVQQAIGARLAAPAPALGYTRAARKSSEDPFGFLPDCAEYRRNES